MEILMQRTLSGLAPIDDAGQEMLRKVAVGRLVKARVTQSRNIHHHRMFFALLNLVYDNLPETVEINSVDALLGALKLATGHYEVCKSSAGKEFRIPKSISFAKMDQTEFDQFFQRCCDVIVKHFLPGVTSEQLRSEILDLVGAR